MSTNYRFDTNKKETVNFSAQETLELFKRVLLTDFFAIALCERFFR